MALRLPGKFAGVIAINGTLPRPAEGPLFRDDEVKDLRVLIAHGAANEVVPLELARRDFLALYGAGADVLLEHLPVHAHGPPEHAPGHQPVGDPERGPRRLLGRRGRVRGVGRPPEDQGHGRDVCVPAVPLRPLGP